MNPETIEDALRFLGRGVSPEIRELLKTPEGRAAALRVIERHPAKAATAAVIEAAAAMGDEGALRARAAIAPRASE